MPRWVDDIRNISSPVWYDHTSKLIIKLALGFSVVVIGLVGLSGNLVNPHYRLFSMFVVMGYFLVDAFDLGCILARRAYMQRYYK